MLFGWIDPMYFVYIGPGLILSLYATWKTKSTFSKYSKVGSRNRMTGAQAAAQMLQRNGISNVKIEHTGGWLSDHYDPRHKVLRLSTMCIRAIRCLRLGLHVMKRDMRCKMHRGMLC